MSATALDAMREIRAKPGFDERQFVRFHEATFAERFGLTAIEVGEVITATRPRVNSDRFEWMEAMVRRHDVGVRTLRVAVAMFGFAGPHGYAWPSQKAIARRAGYVDKGNALRDVRRSISELAGIGAIRIMPIAKLPKELAAKATAATKEGGSGRSYRGSAYALVAENEWPANALIGVSSPSDYRGQEPPYNHQHNPNSLRAGDSSSQLESGSETSQLSPASQNPAMEGARS